MQYEYKTKGTCSRSILFDIEDGKVKNVQFIGGCNGNLKGIGALVEGMNVRYEVHFLPRPAGTGSEGSSQRLNNKVPRFRKIPEPGFSYTVILITY